MMVQAGSPNPLGGVFLLLLIVLSGMAVAGGKGVKWKLLNLLVIIGFMAAGLATGGALTVWGGSGTGATEIGAMVAADLMILLGCVGAFGCMRRNKRRNKVQDAQRG